MSYDSNGVYTRAASTTAVAGQSITASMHETEWEDLKTALNKLPPKDVANTFTTSQTFQLADNGSTFGPIITLDRNSSTPAASDAIGTWAFTGRNSASATKTYAVVNASIIDATASSEDGTVDFLASISGTITYVASIGPGLSMSGVSDRGVGTIAGTNIYSDGSFILKDGISAPGTLSGYAKIYVDSSDGDLKIKFGDGTVKTIVVDT